MSTMSTIQSSKFAGRQVWLGDGKVAFDAEGVAVGVVKRNGRALRPPEPLGPSQFAAAHGSPSYTVTGWEAPAEAAVSPQEAPEVPGVSQAAGTSPAAPAPPQAAAQGLVVGEAPAERDADLADSTRQELYRLAQDMGLDPAWIGSTSDDLRELIISARDQQAPA